MPRTVNRTPRHLDDPLRLGPFTLAQWALLVLAVVAVWLVLRHLAFLPLLWRVTAGAVVVGLTVGVAEGGGGRSLAALPRRAWHALTTPAEHFPGSPRRGPLRFETYDDAPHEEDPPDA
ncbi:MAG: hypothetical protein M3Q65_00615 [Chloroflexota bacterium]|nr:hypothetical protein [Chloroflexota bacterium]